ncbi:MAG: hypothetical protein ACYC3W_10275 [Candidatus Nanopelagicales bacterium]
MVLDAPVAVASALPIWDAVEAFASPSTSLSVIQGGAGAGLGTAGELAGPSLSVSGEVAGVAADGAISLTPVGWALAVAMVASAGGYAAWSNRGQIISAVNSLWNSLSSTDQSNLESQNTPGTSVSIPSDALNPIAAYWASDTVAMQGWAVSAANGGYYKWTVPSWVTPSTPVVFQFDKPPAWPANTSSYGVAFGYPVSAAVGAISGDNSPKSYQVSGAPYGYVAAGSEYDPSNFFSGIPGMQVTLSNLSPGQSVYWVAWWNTDGNYTDSWAGNLPSGLPTPPSDAVFGTATTEFQQGAVPVVASPPGAVGTPTPSNAAPTFWPGTWNPNTSEPQPAGQPAPNPIIKPSSGPYSPPSGLVGFIESLVVPNPVAVEDSLASLQSAFGNRVPFSYADGLIGLLPAWANGVGTGGCATLQIPEFGLGSGGTYNASYCPGGFIDSALALVKNAFAVMLWAFLLGWGVRMFRGLIRS